MNPRNNRALPNLSELLDQSGLPSQLADERPRGEQELELWEPPFERWLRLADDLLRDWPREPGIERRV